MHHQCGTRTRQPVSTQQGHPLELALDNGYPASCGAWSVCSPMIIPGAQCSRDGGHRMRLQWIFHGTVWPYLSFLPFYSLFLDFALGGETWCLRQQPVHLRIVHVVTASCTLSNPPCSRPLRTRAPQTIVGSAAVSSGHYARRRLTIPLTQRVTVPLRRPAFSGTLSKEACTMCRCPGLLAAWCVRVSCSRPWLKGGLATGPSTPLAVLDLTDSQGGSAACLWCVPCSTTHRAHVCNGAADRILRPLRQYAVAPMVQSISSGSCTRYAPCSTGDQLAPSGGCSVAARPLQRCFAFPREAMIPVVRHTVDSTGRSVIARVALRPLQQWTTARTALGSQPVVRVTLRPLQQWTAAPQHHYSAIPQHHHMHNTVTGG